MTQNNDTIRSAPDPLVALRAEIERELEAIRVCTHCDDANPRDQGRLTALRWVLGQVRLASRRAALDSIEEGSREDRLCETVAVGRPWPNQQCRLPIGHFGDHDFRAASPSREGAGLAEFRAWLAVRRNHVTLADIEAELAARLTSEEQREDGPTGG